MYLSQNSDVVTEKINVYLVSLIANKRQPVSYVSAAQCVLNQVISSTRIRFLL